MSNYYVCQVKHLCLVCQTNVFHPAFMYHANDASYVVRFQSGLARLPKAFARTNTSSYD